MAKRLNLLIIEDSEDDALLEVRELRKGGFDPAYRRIETLAELDAALEDPRWDAFIADYNLPGFNGLDALRLVRAKGLDIPAILISGTVGEEQAVEAMKAGAHDYILKGNFTRLVPAMERELKEAEVRRERRQMMESLATSEKKFRTLFEESKDAIFIMGIDNTMVDINPAGVELFGYGREELLTLDFAGRLYCDPAERQRFLQTLSKQGAVRDFEVCMRKKGGEVLHLLKSASLIRNEQGEVTGYQGIIHDVTERKRLEQQLLQSQKMESIGLLAGGVAHDFNNILTAILGYGQLIKQNTPTGDETTGHYISEILSAADRATELTRNLLAFSRKQIINPKPVSVNDIIINLIKMLARIIGEDIDLTTNLAVKAPTIMADSGQIHQVLVNLATNARDAMPNGGRLHIRTKHVELNDDTARALDLESSGWYALIEVADNGVGMDEKTRERIFEPFFTTKEVGEGTGLGLAIIYGIVKQHGGAVIVESEPGRGTTFSIHFPLITAPAGEESVQVAAPPPCGVETLLLAEDDKMVRTYMMKILEAAGYTVLTATNGENAVERFRENRHTIALVICDVVMPKKNGKEVFEEIRAMEPHAKFLFTSGYNNEIIHTKGTIHENIELLTKPISRQRLLSKLREIIDA